MDTSLPFYTYPARKRRPLLGAFIVAVGIGAPFVALALFYTDALRTSFGQLLLEMNLGSSFIADATQIIVPTAIFLAGPLLVKRGLAYRQLDAIELLHRDGRQPILYLRSFDDDGTVDLTNISFSLGVQKTIEMRIAQVFSDFGPVISIGRPGEPLPELGTNRFYVSDEEWQSAVLHFLERSSVVIVFVGSSAGVAWEIREALARVPLEKLLFAFPFVEPKSRRNCFLRITRKDEGLKDALSASMLRDIRAEQNTRYHQFRNECNAVSTAELPERLDDGIFVDFLVDGTPRVLPSHLPLFFRYGRDKQGVTLNYPRTLRPFLSKLTGQEMKPGLAERFFTGRLTLALFGLFLLALAAGLILKMDYYMLELFRGWGFFEQMVVVVGVPLMVLVCAAIAFKRAIETIKIEPIKFVEIGKGKRFVASILGFWLAAPVGLFVYFGGTSPVSDDTVAGGLWSGFVCALAGMIAGATAGFHGRIWMRILGTTVAGSALIMIVSALFGLAWQAADAMDIGDILIPALPLLMVGGAVWGAARQRRDPRDETTSMPTSDKDNTAAL